MTDPSPTDRPDLDLDACATEPIHVPGTIQPHGVLLAVDEADLRVVRASANAAAFLGRDLNEVLGAPLHEVVEGIGATSSTDEELWTSNPRPVGIASGDADAVVHRSGGFLIVELEPAGDREQVAQATSFRRLRGALEHLQSVTSLEELGTVTAREVSRLTSFDRVMVYRFDDDWNGEVVAEERAPGLESFLGLHYPASDIPAQARALYATNWLRLIVDRDYEPVPIVPTPTGADGLPLDLSAAVLRSVSPVHLEYLANMGVVGSMSVSLLNGGQLWGLVSCHHYSGPYRPPQLVRAAAELLARTISLVIPTVIEGEHRRRAADVRAVEDRLVDRLEAREDVAEALTTGTDLQALTRSTGAAVKVDGRISTTGRTPPPEALEEIAAAVLRTTDGGAVGATDSLVRLDPALSDWADVAAGAVAVAIGERDGDWLLWCRPEVARTVTWGGDPRSKVVREDDKISPRKSFDAWTESVAGCCEPWHRDDRDAVDRLARNIGRVLLRRAQLGLHVAAALKRTLLIETLPSVPGAELAVRYRPDPGDLVGGDWYDVFWLPDGRVAVAVGDVAGHGLAAAPVMAHLRHALRAYLLKVPDPGEALERVNDLANALLPWELATIVVADLDPAAGRLRVASAGHLPGVITDDTGARLLDVPGGVPLGAVDAARYHTADVDLSPGATVYFYTDGIVERRTEPLDVGLERLRSMAEELPVPLEEACDRLMTVADTFDDATLLALRIR